jgi:hypothetical protein
LTKLADALLAAMMVTASLLMIGSIAPNASAVGAAIISVDYPVTIPYNGTLSVKILVEHNSSYAPAVDLFYAIVENDRQLGGWRISRGEPVQSDSVGFTLFAATLPNHIYETSLPYNSTLVFYVEVRSPSGQTLVISTNETDRWNSNVRSDKFVVPVTDPYPPEIGLPTVEMPYSNDLIMIRTTVLDDGSRVKNVTFHYGFNDNISLIADTRVISGNNTFWTIITPRANAQKSRLIYYVVAIDNAGNLAETPTYFYDIAPPNPAAASRQNALILVGVIGIVIVASVLVLALHRSRRTGVISETTFKRSALLDFSFFASLVTVSLLVFQLAQGGSLILGLVILMGTVAMWGVLDPRVDTFPLAFVLPSARQTCAENPLSGIMFVGYFVIVIGTVASLANYLLEVYGPLSAYLTASTIIMNGAFLVVLSVVLQLAWPGLQRIRVSITT